ncbi:MAG: S9 family peptidase, partial [Rhodospirillaceae bacterium]|nr:S9 family peptidase [Rhodospirillaceae bacterium]
MNPRDHGSAPTPPRAKRIARATEIHGDTLPDDYGWLRDKADPDVKRYLEDENAYTEAAVAPLADFREALYKEMLARIKETDLSVPYKNGAYWYYTRTVEGLQYPIFCRRPGSMEGAEEITLDVNKLAEGKPYMSIGNYTVSEDGRWLAYSTDETGFRQFKLVV